MAELYNINHDAGNLNEYSATETDRGLLSVTAPAALAGTAYGMQAVIDSDNEKYGERNLGADKDALRIRFYFDPNTPATFDDGHYVALLVVLNSVLDDCAYVYFRKEGKEVAWYISLEILNDSAVKAAVASTIITDQPYYIEIHLYAGTGANGIAKLWVDGSYIGGITNGNYDTRWSALRIVRLGANDVSGIRGTIYLDELVIRDDDTEIGPVSSISLPALLRAIEKY